MNGKLKPIICPLCAECTELVTQFFRWLVLGIPCRHNVPIMIFTKHCAKSVLSQPWENNFQVRLVSLTMGLWEKCLIFYIYFLVFLYM